ncbi:hypothetical protein C5U62_17720 [Pseudomonas protegens]|uniref:Uncharacterized protein n=1 Tax=Pseudomonas protegens TaxID=380021 RepID=A0A2T6GI25_9PSED|nr:hypothetical protein [Pseudomonas sp. Os17]PUA43812.1 hypothetical protein C5U62_17720 [Pseudomonas protegens]RXU61892.1 hypothetical protein CW358_23855 [Pseudomonas protegens]
MNVSSVVKGILLLMIVLVLMACVLPSRGPLVRLGQGGPLSWLVIGQGKAPIGAGYVASAF